MLLLCASMVKAAPVSKVSARTAGLNFLVMTEGLPNDTELELVYTAVGNNGATSYYVFEVDRRGFIAVSADDRFVPILAWCEDTRFDTATMPDYIRSWYNVYRNGIAEAIANDDFDLLPKEKARIAGEWPALLSGDPSFYAKQGQKSMNKLIETKWGQGAGYNLYCPDYSAASTGNGHALVGCVATAMAQILRYWRYGVGFGSNSYMCTYYGRLSMKFDTATYDFSNMPVSSPATPQTATAELRRHHVSQLSYHCGIATNMTYESPQYTGGSGTQTSNVPEALTHFGYYGAFTLSKSSNEHSWDDLLRYELDRRHPLEYSGHSNSEGGHAFICDGYKESVSQYHFNWGWSGSYDGFYTLTTMRSFTYSQLAVFNIVPSYLCNADTLYMSAEAEQSKDNDGSSWEKANPNAHCAIAARGIYKGGVVLMKEGTYYGDTSLVSKDGSFIMYAGVKVYGGFGGTETSISQRNLAKHPTILDGRSSQRVVYVGNTLTKVAYLNDVIIENGQAGNGGGVYISKNLVMEGCTIRNNTATNGAGVYMDNGTLRRCYLYGNNSSSSATLYAKNGEVKNCLITNNRGGGITGNGSCLFINMTIASNAGTGASLGNSNVLRNSIIWNNNTELSGGTEANVTYNAVMGSAPSGTGNIALGSGNEDANGPHFVSPKSTRGLISTEGDWHLMSTASPCYNSGMPDDESTYRWDMDNKQRVWNGVVDMGCYEYKNLGIDDVDEGTIQVYPNPCHSQLSCTGMTPNERVSLYDMSGRCVYSATCEGERVDIDVTALPAGVYVLHAAGTTRKVIVR